MADNSNFEHPLWNTLAQLLQLQAEPSFNEQAVTSNDQLVLARDKVFALGQVIRSLMQTTPAILVSPHALNQLNKHVQAALSELNAYVTNKNTVHINNAVLQFEQNALSWLWGFAPILRTTESDELPQIFDGLR